MIADTTNVRQLFSKVLAGGLSAGVILLWWPLVFPSDTVESWLVRGLLWTLCFELMLHAFAPLEESLWRTSAARGVRAQAVAATARLGTASPHKRRHGRAVVAGFALLVPVMLLATAPADRLTHKRPEASVRQVTEVKRIVRIERRSVTVPRASVPQPVSRSSTRVGEARLASGSVRPAARHGGTRGSAVRRRPVPPSAGTRSGSSSTPADPTGPAATQAPMPTAGSDEPFATAPVAQPKALVSAPLQ